MAGKDRIPIFIRFQSGSSSYNRINATLLAKWYIYSFDEVMKDKTVDIVTLPHRTRAQKSLRQHH